MSNLGVSEEPVNNLTQFESEFKSVCDWFYVTGWQDAAMHPVPHQMLGTNIVFQETVGRAPEQGFKEALTIYTFMIDLDFFTRWNIVEGDATMQRIQKCYLEGYEARQPYDEEHKDYSFNKQHLVGTAVGGIAIGTAVGGVIGLVIGGLVTYLIVK